MEDNFKIIKRLPILSFASGRLPTQKAKDPPAENRTTLKILPPAVLLLFLSSCRVPTAPPENPTTAHVPTISEFLPPAYNATPTLTSTTVPDVDFDLRKAMELLYGAEGDLEVDAQGEVVVRIHGVPDGSDPRDKIIRVLLAASYTEASEEKYILLTETGPEGMGAHAEFALIGGALFHRIRDSWEIEIEQREITWMGSFGHAPDGELLTIGPDKHGFLFIPQWAGQGSMVETAQLIGIVGAELKLIFVHEMRNHSEMENIIWDYSSTMEFLPGRNPEYYDIRMTTQGAKPVKGTVTPFEEVEMFEFNGQEYVPAS